MVCSFEGFFFFRFMKALLHQFLGLQAMREGSWGRLRSVRVLQEGVPFTVSLLVGREMGVPDRRRQIPS
jgi:hypothetical protein